MFHLDELREEVKALTRLYGDKYFVFVAPADLRVLEDRKFLEMYVSKKQQPPDSVLIDVIDLDIYFVMHKHIDGMRIGSALLLTRLGAGGLPATDATQ